MPGLLFYWLVCFVHFPPHLIAGAKHLPAKILSSVYVLVHLLNPPYELHREC